jgi:hypothetical protein
MELISERVGLTNRIGTVEATLALGDYNPLRTGLGEPLPPNAHALFHIELNTHEALAD